MGKRKIIKINEDKCNGCALCIPNCPEGAIQIVGGKARLISDLFCDGLGACLGHCPQGAITIEEREAGQYDEVKVMANIVKQGRNVIRAHFEHLKEHGQDNYLKQAVGFLKEKNIHVHLKENIDSRDKYHTSLSGCPGAKVMDFRGEENLKAGKGSKTQFHSELRQWPVQIMLAPAVAPYLNDADLLVAADCVPFAYAGFHQALLKGKVLLVGCPKLDDLGVYNNKFTQIIKNNNIKSITYAHMEVPCCFGLVNIIKSAIAASGKSIPFQEAVISIKGERLK
jgi:Pyruvate/2-oxoacid:ferredoxin oxidoreductase delta subunit